MSKAVVARPIDGITINTKLEFLLDDNGEVRMFDNQEQAQSFLTAAGVERVQNPRNVGEIENASGVGTVGNAKCGDIMRIYLDIDENQVIQDVKFKTFGCGAAVATSSMATELVKGKTIDEALQVTNKAVMEALDGLPAVKVHCSLLAEEAIHAALWDYAEKHGIKIEGLEKPKSDIHEGEEEEGEEY